MSTPCKLIAPGVAVNGTMSITKNELYFEMDEEDAENKKMDPKVRHSHVMFSIYLVCLDATVLNGSYCSSDKTLVIVTILFSTIILFLPVLYIHVPPSLGLYLFYPTA